MYAILARHFPIRYFLECCFQQVLANVLLGAFFKFFDFFIMLFIHSAFPLRFPSVFLLQNYFVSLCTHHQSVGYIFFRYFGRYCFLWIIWACPHTFWIFFLSPISVTLFLPVVLSALTSVISLGFFGWFTVWFISLKFSPVTVSLFVLLASFAIHVLYFHSDSLEVYRFYY